VWSEHIGVDSIYDDISTMGIAVPHMAYVLDSKFGETLPLTIYRGPV